tara:strand:- start:4149 stop:4304 length:156 start_codon:yes stop_codon:yes gene_type:complete
MSILAILAIRQFSGGFSQSKSAPIVETDKLSGGHIAKWLNDSSVLLTHSAY